MTKQSNHRLLIGLTCLLCNGCARAPAVDIIGSFFPVWMVCLTISILLAGVLRLLLLHYKLEPEIEPVALFYPCVVILLSSLLWLIFFR